MKCRTHRERDAVAVCARCRQTLCHECCAIIGGKVTCRGRCEKDQAAIDRSSAVRREGAAEYRRAVGPAMAVGFGTMMLVAGYSMLGEANSLDSSEMRILAYVAGGLGILLILGAIATYCQREDHA